MKLKSLLVALVVILALASAVAQPVTYAYTSASKGFKITSPVEFTAEPTTTETGDKGESYTAQTATGSNTNGVYVVMIGTYNFPLVKADLDRGVASMMEDPGTVLVSKTYLTVNDSPAVYLIVTKDNARILDLFVIRKNMIYQIMFGAGVNDKPDAAEVDAYFKSFELI